MEHGVLVVGRLSPEAREIGEAVLAEDGAVLAVSTPAQETASKMKSWARANKSRPKPASARR